LVYFYYTFFHQVVHQEEQERERPSGREEAGVIGQKVASAAGEESWRLKEELRQTKDYLENLLNYANAPIIVWDADFRITLFNRASEKLTGWSSGEVAGKPIDILFPEETRDQALSHIKKASLGDRWEVVEIKILDVRGGIHVLLWNSSTLRSPDGEIKATIVQGHEITRRKRAEEALRESEEKYRQMFETMTIGVVYQDARGTIVSANPAAERILGLSLDQMMGRTSLHPEWKSIREDGTELPGPEHPAMVALRTGKKTGPLIMGIFNPATHCYSWISVVAIPLYAPGNETIKQVYTTFEEISERKKAEEALKKSEAQLRELNATKDKFFSIIAHDLKSPFNTILGFSKILIERVSENNLDGISKFSELIHQSAKRAMDLLTNLMEWSRSQSGRIEFSPERFRLNLLIGEVTELLMDHARQKSISVDLLVPEGIWIYGDLAMISTVIRNLLDNAIKFTRPGGAIIITVEERPGETEIAVEDDGIGLSEENAGKLFRIDDSYSIPGTDNESGTGLGLILCREFIGRHGGRIWVESNNKKGCTFRFTIPKQFHKN
jgi:PAS domain S-box-containing protein